MPLLSQVSFVLIVYSEPWRADQLCQLVNELRPGMRVASFSDGRSALAACRRQVPSLLILDGELEGLDGIALLRELRQHGPTQRLPCVLISERTDAISVRAVLPLAPAAYLGKPYDLDDLRQRLDKLLPRSAGARWRLPLGLRQLIGAYYALGAGALSREALVLNLVRLLMELPPETPPAHLAESRPARLLRLDPALLEQAPLAAER